MRKQGQVAVSAESLASEQAGKTYASVPSSQGSSQTGGENQAFEDDPAEVSSQTVTETRMICSHQATPESTNEGRM